MCEITRQFKLKVEVLKDLHLDYTNIGIWKFQYKEFYKLNSNKIDKLIIVQLKKDHVYKQLEHELYGTIDKPVFEIEFYVNLNELILKGVDYTNINVWKSQYEEWCKLHRAKVIKFLNTHLRKLAWYSSWCHIPMVKDQKPFVEQIFANGW